MQTLISQLLVSVLFITVPTNTENFYCNPCSINSLLQHAGQFHQAVETSSCVGVYYIMWEMSES